MAQKRVGTEFGTDRISNLPFEVIGHILKYLPLRDAARTSTLSREWRYKWLTTPRLVFDVDFLNLFDKEWDFIDTIYHVLLLHKGPIFEFQLEDSTRKSARPVDCWLNFLSNHPIQTLKLCMTSSSFNASPYVIPHSFFSFVHLRSLHLYNVVVGTPLSFKGFSSLVSVRLDNVDTEAGELKRFLSKCPIVESLKIWNYKIGDWSHDIEAPNLKSFQFDGRCNSLRLQSASLEKLCLQCICRDVVYDESYVGERDKIKVFCQLSSVRKLQLNPYAIEILDMGGVPLKHVNLNNLTLLRLTHFQYGKIDGVTGALCLIKRSPNLQRLEIEYGSYLRYLSEDSAAIQYLKAQHECEISLNHLKTVKLDGFTCLEFGRVFLKLLLLWATVLETLEVKYGYHPDTTATERILFEEELASFPRASSDAVIITH